MKLIDKLANKVLKQLLKHEFFAIDEPEAIAKKAYDIAKEMYNLSLHGDSNLLKPGTKIVFNREIRANHGPSSVLCKKNDFGRIIKHLFQDNYLIQRDGIHLDFTAKLHTDFTLSFE